MSEKRTKAEKLQQQIEKAEKAINALPDEAAQKNENAKKPTTQVLRK